MFGKRPLHKGLRPVGGGWVVCGSLECLRASHYLRIKGLPSAFELRHFHTLSNRCHPHSVLSLSLRFVGVVICSERLVSLALVPHIRLGDANINRLIRQELEVVNDGVLLVDGVFRIDSFKQRLTLGPSVFFDAF